VIDGAVNGTVSSEGVELAFVEAGDPARPTVVLVHGYPDTKELWDGVLTRLAERYHVIAYDVRGAGASSKPRGPAAYDFERLGDDLGAVIAALAPDGQVHLVGHDWGAIQGWEFVTEERFRNVLASFTAIAGPSLDQLTIGGYELLRHPGPGHLAEVARRLRRSWYIVALWTPGVPTLAWRGTLARRRWVLFLEQLERIRGARRALAPTLASDGVHGAKLYRRNIPRRLLRPRRDASVRVPVQLIRPTRDHFISPSYYDFQDGFVPQLQRRTIATTHWAPRTEPERLARWIGEFVDGVESGTPLRTTAPWVPGGGTEQLRDRLAIVTGAASGIGLATARALADEGARLLLVDRDGEGLERAAGSIPQSQMFACDVSDERAMERLATRVLGEHGVPDVVVNNAGIGVAGPFVETDLEDLNRIVGVNLLGVIYGCRLFGRAMVERGAGGQIVNTASMAAFMPTKDLGTYAATKAAVLMLSESLRAELSPHGIGVTAVCPGFVATNITRATRYVGLDESDRRRISERVSWLYERRNFTPERVAAEVVRAIGDDLPVALVTPETKLIHALTRFAPGVLRRLAKLDVLPV
jgi:NAD(P)-dependent dehydrogenase (short-subunit alcohol dehydrogenase family)/pimeloyl-ACP methyl ester carboxylesterase